MEKHTILLCKLGLPNQVFPRTLQGLRSCNFSSLFPAVSARQWRISIAQPLHHGLDVQYSEYMSSVYTMTIWSNSLNDAYMCISDCSYNEEVISSSTHIKSEIGLHIHVVVAQYQWHACLIITFESRRLTIHTTTHCCFFYFNHNHP